MDRNYLKKFVWNGAIIRPYNVGCILRSVLVWGPSGSIKSKPVNKYMIYGVEVKKTGKHIRQSVNCVRLAVPCKMCSPKSSSEQSWPDLGIPDQRYFCRRCADFIDSTILNWNTRLDFASSTTSDTVLGSQYNRHGGVKDRWLEGQTPLQSAKTFYRKGLITIRQMLQ